jgi:hypothetical protein
VFSNSSEISQDSSQVKFNLINSRLRETKEKLRSRSCRSLREKGAIRGPLSSPKIELGHDDFLIDAF